MIKSFYTESRKVINVIVECSYIRLFSFGKREKMGKPVGFMSRYNWIRRNGPQDAVSVAARLQYFDQIMNGFRRSRGKNGIERILEFYGDTVFWIDDNLYHRANGVGVVHSFCTTIDESVWSIRAYNYIDEFSVDI